MAVLGTILGIANAGLAIGSTVKNWLDQKKKDAIAKKEADRAYAENMARAYEDPMSNSANQQVINQYDRDAKKQIENARNVAAITGATPEYGLAVQKAVAEGKSNLLGNIAAGASDRKDKYLDKASDVKSQYAAYQQEQAAAAQESAMNGLINAGNAIGSVVDSISATPKATAAPTAAKKVKAEVMKGKSKLKTGMAAPTNFVEKSAPDAYEQGSMVKAQTQLPNQWTLDAIEKWNNNIGRYIPKAPNYNTNEQ